MTTTHDPGRSRRGVIATLLVLMAGCGDDGTTMQEGSGSGPSASQGTLATSDPGTSAADDTAGGVPMSIIDLDAFVAVPAAEDPWAAERPADAVCELGWGVEDNLFEVDSALCTWGTFVQPTLLPVAAGDTLELIVVHDALYSEDEGAVAHIAVALDGQVAWETELEIPQVQDILRPTFAAPADAPAGTPVYIHVHNHGFNNYRFVDLTVR